MLSRQLILLGAVCHLNLFAAEPATFSFAPRVLFKDSGYFYPTPSFILATFVLPLEPFNAMCRDLSKQLDSKLDPDLSAISGRIRDTCTVIRSWPNNAYNVQSVRNLHPTRHPDVSFLESMQSLGLRKRRQALLLLGSLLGIIGSETLHALLAPSSSVPVARIDHIEASLHQLDHRTTAINATLFKLLDQEMLLKEETERFQHLQQLSLAVLDLESSVTRVSQGLFLLKSSQRASPFILPASLLDLLAKRTLLKAQDLGLDVPSHQSDMFYELPASHIVEGKGEIRVVIHVPLITKSLQLKQLIPVPLAIKDSSHPIPAVLEILPQKTFIAETKDFEFIEMSTADLKTCLLLGRHHFCPQAVFRRDRSASCIASLSAGKIHQAATICPVKVSTKEWAMEALGNANFLLFTAKPLQVSKKFANGSIISQWIQGYKAISAADADIFSEKFRVSQMHQDELDSVTVIAENLEQPWKTIIGNKSVADFNELKQSLVQLGIREPSVEQILGQPYATFSHVSFAAIAIGITAVLLACFLIAYLYYQYRKVSRSA